MQDPWDATASCLPGRPVFLGQNMSENSTVYGRTEQQSWNTQKFNTIILTTDDEDDDKISTAVEMNTEGVKMLCDQFEEAHPRRIVFCDTVAVSTVGDLGYLYHNFLSDVTLMRVPNIATIDLRSAPLITRLVAFYCDDLQSILLHPHVQVAVAVRCDNLRLVAAGKTSQKTTATHVAALECGKLAAVYGADQLTVANCHSLWLVPDTPPSAVRVEGGCDRLRLPLLDNVKIVFVETIPRLRVSVFEDIAQLKVGNDLFALPAVPTRTGPVYCNFKWKPATTEEGQQNIQMTVAASPVQWHVQMKTLDRHLRLDQPIVDRALALVADPQVMGTYHADNNSSTSVSLYTCVTARFESIFVVSKVPLVNSALAYLTSFTARIVQSLNTTMRSFPSIAAAAHYISECRTARGTQSMHFVGDLRLEELLNECLNGRIPSLICVTISHNSLLVALRLNFEAIKQLRIAHCRNLSYVRASFYTSEVTVQDCPRLLCVNSPHPAAQESDEVLNVVAVECSLLESIITNGRIFVQSCPALSHFPRDLSLDSNILVGPGCPRLPVPQAEIGRVWLMPELADKPVVAVNMRHQWMYDDEELDNLEAELLEVTVPARPYIDLWTMPHLPVSHPHTNGVFTLCPFQRTICLVESPANLSHAKYAPLVHREMKAALMSARRRRQYLSYLPVEIWMVITDFLLLAQFTEPPEGMRTTFWQRQA
jgi:hypothetical protein